MFSVRVPATSANLGSGFDVLGLAFDVFNEYNFEEAEEFSLKGFAPKYLDLNHNLVLSSYKKAFERVGKTPIFVRIKEKKRDIPRSGGLGSSAACAVAGILGANKMMGGVLDKNEILQLAGEIDGHFDNVSAAIFGGLTACYKTDGGERAQKYGVSEKLHFTICCPDFYVSTEMARSVLPKSVEVKKAVENLSHIVNMPRAFENGDIELLSECVKDNFHEPFRIKLIEEGELIRSVAKSEGAVAIISGSGASMLVVSTNDKAFCALKNTKTKHKWTFKTVKPYYGEVS